MNALYTLYVAKEKEKLEKHMQRSYALFQRKDYYMGVNCFEKKLRVFL